MCIYFGNINGEKIPTDELVLTQKKLKITHVCPNWGGEMCPRFIFLI